MPGTPFAFLYPLILILLLGACQQLDYYPPKEAEGGWRTTSNHAFIRSLQLLPDKLAELGEYGLSVKSSEVSSVLVIKDGWLVGEWYSAPQGKTTRMYVASVGKSFATICFGIAEQDSRTGTIPYQLSKKSNVYDRRWLPMGFPLSDPRKKEITFDHIFRQTSGITPENSTVEKTRPIEMGRNQWDDYVAWVVGHDPAWPQTARLFFPPGRPELYPGHARWGEHRGAYSSVGYAHIGLVLAELYQMPAHQFLETRLLEPLGFSGIDYEEPPAPPHVKWFSAGGLHMTPRDFARFAYLLLREGRWRQQQLVAKQWLQEMTSTPFYENLRSNSDGYLGQHYPPDLLRLFGSGGNFAFIVPSHDLIVLKTGRIDNLFLERHMHDFLRRTFLMIPGYAVDRAR
ncbi:serine hydrolase domain-containing protein [Desulfofustis glycolicus]|uniref:CubicO group peptidase, beta-lactamase class C family n=1 Tax=Desulfofustis glycolicus DSM 9705 TaxID=1121409 RepID=A0A1M5WLV4_9BACT|nr:serine hydrolase [Desulfofustis glycolicus]SHH88402.1 CubicO group peptidase, beta-lactamase class C family [Desulfofustis glycolicus DSM 9705]